MNRFAKTLPLLYVMLVSTQALACGHNHAFFVNPDGIPAPTAAQGAKFAHDCTISGHVLHVGGAEIFWRNGLSVERICYIHHGRPVMGPEVVVGN